MHEDNEIVTLGEVYRTVQRIERAVNLQNGRVTTLERDIDVLKDRDLRGKDAHARVAGWGGVITAALSLWWSIFHGGRP